MNTSEIIINRLRESGSSFFANDNIAGAFEPGEREELLKEIEGNVRALLSSLIIDVENDHNTRETARRVAKMYVNEIFKGRYDKEPNITTFPNAKKLDELYTLGPIEFKSACSHHFVEIEGNVWVGIIPGDTLIGISKISRLVDWIARRPQIQEEAAVMIADKLDDVLDPKGLAVVIKAKHHCMTWRGVEESSTEMVTSVVRGILEEDVSAKKEFFDLIRGQKF